MLALGERWEEGGVVGLGEVEGQSDLRCAWDGD